MNFEDLIKRRQTDRTLKKRKLRAASESAQTNIQMDRARAYLEKLDLASLWHDLVKKQDSAIWKLLRDFGLTWEQTRFLRDEWIDLNIICYQQDEFRSSWNIRSGHTPNRQAGFIDFREAVSAKVSTTRRIGREIADHGFRARMDMHFFINPFQMAVNGLDAQI